MAPGWKSGSSKRDGNLQQFLEGTKSPTAKPPVTKCQKETSSTPVDTEATPASQVTGTASPTHAQSNTMGAPEEGTADATSTPVDMESPVSQHDHSAMPPHSNHSNTKAPATTSTPSTPPPVQSTSKTPATTQASSLATAARVTTGTTLPLPLP